MKSKAKGKGKGKGKRRKVRTPAGPPPSSEERFSALHGRVAETTSLISFLMDHYAETADETKGHGGHGDDVDDAELSAVLDFARGGMSESARRAQPPPAAALVAYTVGEKTRARRGEEGDDGEEEEERGRASVEPSEEKERQPERLTRAKAEGTTSRNEIVVDLTGDREVYGGFHRYRTSYRAKPVHRLFEEKGPLKRPVTAPLHGRKTWVPAGDHVVKAAQVGTPAPAVEKSRPQSSRWRRPQSARSTAASFASAAASSPALRPESARRARPPSAPSARIVVSSARWRQAAEEAREAEDDDGHALRAAKAVAEGSQAQPQKPRRPQSAHPRTASFALQEPVAPTTPGKIVRRPMSAVPGASHASTPHPTTAREIAALASAVAARAEAESQARRERGARHFDEAPPSLQLRTDDVSYLRDEPAKLEPMLRGKRMARVLDAEMRNFAQEMFDSLQPAGRSETIMLARWLEDMVADVRRKFRLNSDKDDAEEEYVTEMSAVLLIVFQDLCRQSFVHCQERGALLSRVWNLSAELMHVRVPVPVERDEHEYAVKRVKQLEDDLDRSRAQVNDLLEELRRARESNERRARVVDEEHETLVNEIDALTEMLDRVERLAPFVPQPMESQFERATASRRAATSEIEELYTNNGMRTPRDAFESWDRSIHALIDYFTHLRPIDIPKSILENRKVKVGSDSGVQCMLGTDFMKSKDYLRTKLKMGVSLVTALSPTRQQQVARLAAEKLAEERAAAEKERAEMAQVGPHGMPLSPQRDPLRLEAHTESTSPDAQLRATRSVPTVIEYARDFVDAETQTESAEKEKRHSNVSSILAKSREKAMRRLENAKRDGKLSTAAAETEIMIRERAARERAEAEAEAKRAEEVKRLAEAGDDGDGEPGKENAGADVVAGAAPAIDVNVAALQQSGGRQRTSSDTTHLKIPGGDAAGGRARAASSMAGLKTPGARASSSLKTPGGDDASETRARAASSIAALKTPGGDASETRTRAASSTTSRPTSAAGRRAQSKHVRDVMGGAPVGAPPEDYGARVESVPPAMP